MSKIEVEDLNRHKKYMARAFMLAEQALDEGEVPVGALVVYQDRIIGKGYNQVERLNDPTAHAEMLALSAACESLGSKYLTGCTLYVTLEPCAMCAGAVSWSKIDRVVFGALDAQAGGCGSRFNITGNKALNHKPELIHGIMEKDSEYLLKAFFSNKRS